MTVSIERHVAPDLALIARKITATLFLGQCLASAGFIAAATVSSIAGAQLSGHPSWAGVPSAVYLIGSALAAFAWGYAMDRLGRRVALALGLLCGLLGAGAAAGAVAIASFSLFLSGMVLMGAAQAAVQLGRFAAAEVHPPSERGRAISHVVLGGTAGAIFGPLMVGPMGRWSHAAGLNELAGPYLAGLLLFGAGAVVIFMLLRPDPRDVGRRVASHYDDSAGAGGVTRPIRAIVGSSGGMTAIGSMVFAQMTMMMVMVITSLHMKDHHHSLGSISVVISSHTIGMFAFSVISGRLADYWGRGPVIIIGAGTLILACLAAPLSPQVLPIAVALFLLGLGWNFCYVGGSSLLADQLSPAERSRVQGFNDLLIGLASAAGSLGSGIIFAAVGYGTMGVVGAIVAALPLFLALRWQMARPAFAPGPP